MKSVILFSDKSSGSTIFQSLFSQQFENSLLISTRHFENESLFWVKVCSVLGLPQANRFYSEVPISRKKALDDLSMLARQYEFSLDHSNLSLETFYRFWRKIVSHHQIFFEKSPHHLGSWCSLDLIVNADNFLNDIDFKYLGLVRNPYDCILSQFRRWGGNPSKIEFNWNRSYSHLIRLKQILGDRLFIFKYEELVTNSLDYSRLSDFLGLPFNPDISTLHSSSVNSYSCARDFRIQLSRDTKTVMDFFGYEVSNCDKPCYSKFSKLSGDLRRIISSTVEKLK